MEPMYGNDRLRCEKLDQKGGTVGLRGFEHFRLALLALQHGDKR
jgi:hypothetical protein